MRWSFALPVAATLLAAAPARAEVLPSDVILVEDVGGKITAANGPLAEGYLGKAACAAYSNETDNWDALFVFSAEPLGAFWGTPAGITVRQVTKGIGKPNVNMSAQFCSQRLRHAARMGGITVMPDDPDAEFKSGPGGTGLSGVEVMGHEMGHQWLAYVGYDLGDGYGRHCNIRSFVTGEGNDGDCDGYKESAWGVHWSPYFASGGVMFGNQIEDLGDGTFRFGGDGDLVFGRLDQYLMGIRLAEEVGPLLLVKPEPGSGIEPGDYPLPPGQTKVVGGTRVDLGIDDVIRAQGERWPAAEACHWKAAIVLVHPQGKPPSAATLAKLAKYGNRYEEWWEHATGGRGSFDMTRDNRGAGTAGCADPKWAPPPDGTDDPAPAGEAQGSDEPQGADEAIPEASEAAEPAGEEAGPDATTGPGDAPADAQVPSPDAATAAGDAREAVAGDPGTGASRPGAGGGGCGAGVPAAAPALLLALAAALSAARRKT